MACMLVLLAYHAQTGKRYLYVDALHKRYGPFVQITPTQASCATPSMPSKIYSYGFSSLPKLAFYCAFHVPSNRTSSLFTSFFPSREGTSQPSFFDPGTPNLFSTQDCGGHARMGEEVFGGARKDVKCLGGLGKGLAVGAETPGRAAGSEGNLNMANDHVSTDTTGMKMATNTSMNIMAGSIASATTNNHSSSAPFIDILTWLNYMTFDVISSLAFGRPLAHDLQPEKTNALASQINTNTPHPSKHGSEVPESHYRGHTAAFLGLSQPGMPSSIPFFTAMRGGCQKSLSGEVCLGASLIGVHGLGCPDWGAADCPRPDWGAADGSWPNLGRHLVGTEWRVYGLGRPDWAAADW
ncbi:hypothetical protein JB92DRAFT_2824903 [Gautieria morchelliformis]|nr:hypothetical protein JB92DRAFT_2824903 [Gautieria morchelliformis]